jgi:gluconokinase
VSGCGKTTVASALAERLGWDYVEADGFHPTSNIEKMTAGIPLGDEDRWPWLDAMASYLEVARERQRPCVLACSALKRRYRDRLAGGHRDIRLVYLRGSYETIVARLAGRTGHYMPPSLLQSQFEALEEPGAEEDPIMVSVESGPETIVEEIVGKLDSGPLRR